MSSPIDAASPCNDWQDLFFGHCCRNMHHTTRRTCACKSHADTSLLSLYHSSVLLSASSPTCTAAEPGGVRRWVLVCGIPVRVGPKFFMYKKQPILVQYCRTSGTDHTMVTFYRFRAVPGCPNLFLQLIEMSFHELGPTIGSYLGSCQCFGSCQCCGPVTTSGLSLSPEKERTEPAA